MCEWIPAAFCNSADRVIAPTRKARDLLLSYGVVRDMSVIATGIDTGKFQERRIPADKLALLRQKFGIREDDKIMISVGRVSKEKSIDELLRVMKTYLPARPNVRFLIVGGGPAKKELEAMCFDFGLDSLFDPYGVNVLRSRLTELEQNGRAGTFEYRSVKNQLDKEVALGEPQFANTLEWGKIYNVFGMAVPYHDVMLTVFLALVIGLTSFGMFWGQKKRTVA